MPTIPRFLRQLFGRRHGGVALFVLLYLCVASATRFALFVKAGPGITWDAGLAAVFAWGLLFDLGAALLASAPLLLLLTLLPARALSGAWARVLVHVGGAVTIYLLLFAAVAEWFFWDEFGARFNFIAVDYLVYTTEVLGNIRESYPVPTVVMGVGAATLGLWWWLARTGVVERWLACAHEPAGARWTAGVVWGLAAVAAGLGLESERLPAFTDNYQRELAKNGTWSLFAAFRRNELDYQQFYATVPMDDAFRALHEELAEHRHSPVSADSPAGRAADTAIARDSLRWIPAPHAGPALRPNVIQITVESLSAEFLGIFNPQSDLTPNLDALAAKSLVFTNCYATGTRTDRGMEALTLGLPPTPGRSLIKRPHNDNLFTLGSVLRTRGYDTAFIYGGYGYFDNMNAFFGGNGYRIVDRAAVAKTDITFANAWGACDEDVFRWTIREADRAHASGKPFHFFVMTTSNHRPYTYPEGRIDLPSKVSGRWGAVKYTDHAIGLLLAEAARHPWFHDTVFVIVADHCASVAGRAELPVQNYHIPLLVYAPGGHVAPGRRDDLMSQVDYAPTLLGLLNWSYPSRFFGWDVIHSGGDRRALIGNYQTVALYEPGMLDVLKPVREHAAYAYDATTHRVTPRPSNDRYARETIAYYQTASYLYRSRGYRAVAADEWQKLDPRVPREQKPDSASRERARTPVHAPLAVIP